ncbi:MAG: DegT/DnrJ/EryC1/StrS family aminotransferase [Acidobacteria bacterium]|nr:DegT/DnrJ/EryC1/StrS family aminotransferase [Acidobacteriota bacterium]MBI3278609.1 DegT/DnrJ/EryC1/StrS family aminotransferase [Acidobacteriota bacterium]
MIPYSDLQAQYAGVRDEVLEAVRDALDNGHYILGPAVERLERDFATYCGAGHAVAVNSGTSALHLALLAAGVGPGDEVITVPFTFIASVASILYCGARPALVDIDARTFNMDASRIERAITPRTRAILPVHLYGQPAEMDAILEIARRHRLAVIEDAAQAHGAEYRGRRAGSMGELGCFSFYPTKNLGACGEGGMVTTHDAGLARTVRLLRDWGQDRKYHFALRGFNYRMHGVQGAILEVKLRHLERWNERRRRAAALYDELLAASGVVTPAAPPYVRHVYHAYTIRSQARDALRAWLTERGIQTAIHYPQAAHLQDAYADLGYKAGDFPVAEQAAREVISLPMHGEIGDEDVRAVVEAVRAFRG